MIEGFKKFILRGNVVELAVGVVIGASFNGLVSAMVRDIITPFLGIMGGQPDFSLLYFSINGSRFNFGDFINAFISFLIVSCVVYFLIVLPMNKLNEALNRGKTTMPDNKKCPFCYTDIPLKAVRCPHCTSQLKS